MAPSREPLAASMDQTAHRLTALQPTASVMVVSAPVDKQLAAENEQLRTELDTLKQAEATRQQAAENEQLRAKLAALKQAEATRQQAAENEQLRTELDALKQAEATRQQAAIVRAHRLERMERATLRIIDRRAAYRGPQVIITMNEVHLAEHLMQ